MNVLVCIKRVPDTGARFELTADAQEIDTRNMEYAISPHEECAVEEAIRLVEKHGGSATVLTLGSEAASEQIREALAKGVERGVLLETDGKEWDAGATAQAIVEAIRATPFDVILFGNECADAGNYQVGVRVAQQLGLPCVTGIKALEINGGMAQAKCEVAGGWEVYEVPMPAVFTVKEGINTPRHPSLRGIMAAKKKEIGRVKPTQPNVQLLKKRLKKPPERSGKVEILGQGKEAASAIVAKLKELGVIQ
ncbi:MAG: electron transfer flavoprotein subunit beta [Candidatus Fraserbacteria bacterium RBG_16_55_9]|uniref:Electron transfer flavoprotein subunit beta n=1 Tax=Fraserbacteria sp. (strain RBG_16_55_9) TaxID=1817864 RepID=A0A1F5V0F8_FRAXR|nr:MAG: electron transfer flavoprotein subunit beta [Candidatus Fraserbacteria bacterium RBG_16_55_9]